MRFDPASVRPDTVPPVIHLDSLSTDSRTFTQFTDLIMLSCGTQRLRLYFPHDLNPLLPDNIRFRYRLAGDSLWPALSAAPFAEIPARRPAITAWRCGRKKMALSLLRHR